MINFDLCARDNMAVLHSITAENMCIRVSGLRSGCRILEFSVTPSFRRCEQLDTDCRIVIPFFRGSSTLMCKISIVASLAILVIVSGCEAFTAPLANPAIVHTIPSGVTTSIASTSDRRLIIISPSGKVCPEAPPDATESVSSSLATTLAASLQTTSGVSPEAKLAIASQVATALAHITQPSQGILLYKFGMAYLCNEYMNGLIDHKVYASAANEMLLIAQNLTQQELVLSNGKIGPDVAASTAPTTSATTTTDTATAGSPPAAGAGTPDKATKTTTTTTKPQASTETPKSASTVEAVTSSEKSVLLKTLQNQMSLITQYPTRTSVP